MIPKVIHYCWFGRGEMPPLALKCIESWKRFLPDYELKEWNEETFDLQSNRYVREAYEAKKYAFVTDYVRLWAIYHYGGIYMDTDVEVLKNLDCFLAHPAFTGYEREDAIPTGIMASEPKGVWAKTMLDMYADRRFIKPNGKMDLTTNVKLMTNYMRSHGLVLKSSMQNFENILQLYPKDYFCPKDCLTGEIHLTANSYCIHHFSGSWKEKKGFWSRTWKKIRTTLFPSKKHY